jgi:hypothetical protein
MKFQQRLIPNQGTKTSIGQTAATATQVLNDVPYGMHRTALVITNTSASSQIVTISEGFGNGSIGGGIPLYGNSSMWQSDGDGYTCSQNAFYATSSAASGQLNFYEQLETNGG